jgi:hypothetical protein
MKTGTRQTYRRYLIVRTEAGYAIQRPSGAHWQTVRSYPDAIRAVDREVNQPTWAQSTFLTGGAL